MSTQIRSYLLVILVSCFSALAGLLFGYDTGVISGAIAGITTHFGLSQFAVESVVSSVLLGALVGALASGQFNDRCSRRLMLTVAAIGFVIGSIISACAFDILSLLLGRFIVGLAIGVGSYTAPLYIAELAPPKYRGGLVALNTVMVTAGIVFAYIVDLIYCHHLSGWRYMFGWGLLPACLLLLGVRFLPNSPRWMVKQGRFAVAKRILMQLQGPKEGKREYELVVSHNGLLSDRVSWRHLFQRRYMKVLIIGCGLAVIQQVCGINAILYYAPTIFQAAGFQQAGAQLLATIGIGSINVLMTIVAIYLVDRLGRRQLLLFGLGLVFLSLLMVALVYQNMDVHPEFKWLVLAGLISFMVGYGVSIGCVFWIMIAEIYPMRIRGKAMCFATGFNWFSNSLVSWSFLSLLSWLGPSVLFSVYAVAVLLSWLFCYYLVPETKAVTLEQLEHKLGISYAE